MKRCAIILPALLLTMLPWFALRSYGEPVAGDLKIFVLNVGQGDAILLVCPHGRHRLLIDSGARGYPGSQESFQDQMTRLVPGVKPRIDVVVATHPHDDHVAGLHWILTNFRVKKFVDNGKPYTSTFEKVRTLAQTQVNAGTLLYFAADKRPAPSVIDFCPASNIKAELLIPDGFGSSKNVNNNSVVVLVKHNDLKFVFTGDAEKAEERQLVDDARINPRLSGATFYKVGHHGAETSSTPALLDLMKPQAAAISAGCKDVARNKGHRHPRALIVEDLLRRLSANPARAPLALEAGDTAKGKWKTVPIDKEGIYITGLEDTILLLSSGSSLRRAPTGFDSRMGRCPTGN